MKLLIFSLILLCHTLPHPVQAEDRHTSEKTKDYNVLTINGTSLTRSQMEKQFQQMSHMPNPPKWEEIPPDMRDAMVKGLAHQYVLTQAAIKAIKDDNPHLKERMDALRDQVRLEIYTEEIMKQRLTPDIIEKEFALQASQHASQRALHIHHLFTRHGWKARQAYAALKDGKKPEEVKAMLNMLQIDLGEVTRKDLFFPQVEQAVMPLKAGQYSTPVRTPFGWHIFLALEEGLASLPNRETLIPIIQRNLWERLWKEHVKSLMKNVTIIYQDDKGKKLPLPW